MYPTYRIVHSFPRIALKKCVQFGLEGGGHEHGVRLILYFSMCRLLLVFGFKWKDFIVWKVPAFLVP